MRPDNQDQRQPPSIKHVDSGYLSTNLIWWFAAMLAAIVLLVSFELAIELRGKDICQTSQCKSQSWYLNEINIAKDKWASFDNKYQQLVKLGADIETCTIQIQQLKSGQVNSEYASDEELQRVNQMIDSCTKRMEESLKTVRKGIYQKN